VIAVKTRTTCHIDGYETYIVEVKLPNLIQLNLTHDNFTTTEACDALCTLLRGIADVTRALTASMQTSITQLLERIYDLIPDISEMPLGQRCKPRALFSLEDRIAHYLFGKAEDATVELKKQIAEIKSMTDSALADSTNARRTMADYTRIASQRLDNMHSVLNKQHKSIALVAHRIRQMSDSQDAWANALMYSLVELSRFIQIHDQIAQLESGIDAMVSSQLTLALISVNDIRAMLTNMTRT
jgi:hypothetical protein